MLFICYSRNQRYYKQWFSNDIELKNLQSITLGPGAFQYASVITIEGEWRLGSNNQVDLPLLKSITLGSEAFYGSQSELVNSLNMRSEAGSKH